MTSKSTNSNQQSQQSQTQQGVDPRLDQYWMSLMGDVDKARGSVDRSALTGPAVAGNNQFDAASLPNQTQLGGIADYKAMLSQLGGSFAPGTFTNNALQAARGDMLNPGTNPYLEGQMDAAIRPITERLTREVIPGIDTAAIAQNAFGGDRANLLRGQAGGDWAHAAGDIRANMLGENYQRERNIQLMAPQLMMEALGAETAIPQATLNLGDYEQGLNARGAETQRGMDQRLIDQELVTRMVNEQLAFAGLGPAAQILGSAPFGRQTSSMSGTSTSTQTQKQDPLTAVGQGVLGIGSMMAGLGWNPFAGNTAPPVTGYAPQYYPTPQIMSLPRTQPSPVQY